MTSNSTINAMNDDLLDILQPSQIICLEHAGQRLYVEVIQLLRDRQSGWLRPLCFCIPAHLCTDMGETNSSPLRMDDENYILHDMRQGADLIWPLSQCRLVLDTEAIPILATLSAEPHPITEESNTRNTLKMFIHQAWNDLPYSISD